MNIIAMHQKMDILIQDEFILNIMFLILNNLRCINKEYSRLRLIHHLSIY